VLEKDSQVDESREALHEFFVSGRDSVQTLEHLPALLDPRPFGKSGLVVSATRDSNGFGGHA